VLISTGYQLAFRTRSSEPRTWFNFDRDILFLEFNFNSYRSHQHLLCGGPWDVGQFDPGDMQRVQKLALDGSGDNLWPCTGRFVTRPQNLELCAILRLFGGLSELLLVEGTESHVEEYFETTSASGVGSQRRNQEAFDPSQRHWTCIPVEEIDALFSLFPLELSWRLAVHAAGEKAEFLRAHIREKGRTARFFRDMQLGLEQRLTGYRDAVVAASSGGSVNPWTIPTIRAVHILPRWMLRPLSQERLRTAKEISKLQAKWISIVKSKMVSAPQWQDDEKAFAEENWPERTVYLPQDEEQYYEIRRTNNLRKWWIQEAPLSILGDLGV